MSTTPTTIRSHYECPDGQGTNPPLWRWDGRQATKRPLRRFLFIASALLFGGMDMVEVSQGATTAFGIPWMRPVFAVWLIGSGLWCLWDTCHGR